MATHDYVIANGTGNAVRSDLNNALAAIVSNNSNSSEPATKYAYQWWADTTTGQLKLRNSANNGWVTIFELDGTMLMEDGTVSAPGLAFASDLNTGFFRSAADKINFATGGVERLEIGSSEVVFNDDSNDVDFRVESNGNTHMLFVDGGNNAVGIGASSPSDTLHLNGSTGYGLKITDASSHIGVYRTHSDGAILKTASNHALLFGTNDTERARLDSSGRLLVGSTSTSNTGLLCVKGNASSSTGAGELTLQKGTGVTGADQELGAYNLGEGSASTAKIRAFTGANWTGSSRPTHLTFETTASGSSGSSERVRISSSGNFGIGTTSPQDKLHIRNGAFAGVIVQTGRTASGTSIGSLLFRDGSSNNSAELLSNVGGTLLAKTNGSERMQIDSSGRLLVGTSSSRSNAVVASKLQIEGTGAESGLSIIRNGSGNAAYLQIGSTGGSSVGSTTASPGNTDFSQIVFSGSDGSAMKSGAYITAQVNQSGAWSSGDCPTALKFSTTADGASSPTERMRIVSSGDVLIGNTTAFSGSSSTETGHRFESIGVVSHFRNSGTALYVGRQGNDGQLVSFRQAGSEEGSISVSGSTVSYNGAHLSRWSQLAAGAARTEILRGSVLSNLDEMCEWAYDAQDAVLYTEEDELPEGASVGDVKTPAVAAGTEDNEQLNRMKVSDVEGDRNVSGVFQAWDDDDDTYVNDFYCAMTGDFVIRIAQGTTVARGDLLMSAGDGTAKPQDDDIVRSKTIAKVTSTTVSTTYSDNSYCVPCVLMAC